MEKDRQSYTAEASAAMRAAGTYEKDEKLRNPDFLAEKLLAGNLSFLVGNSLLRKISLIYAEWSVPGLYEGHLARSHHYDKLVKEDLDGGAEQYVILGAGLDSRPYRFSEKLRNCRVFEVDHPNTSRFKRERLKKAGIKTDHVTYVEVDFEKDTVKDRLTASGFKTDKRTVLTWEGVIMYLNEAAVTDVLKFVASLPSNSSIVFDYFFEDVITKPEKFSEAKKHLEKVKKLEEPYTFGINPEDMEAFVSKLGLKLVGNLRPEDLNSQPCRPSPGRERLVRHCVCAGPVINRFFSSR